MLSLSQRCLQFCPSLMSHSPPPFVPIHNLKGELELGVLLVITSAHYFPVLRRSRVVSLVFLSTSSSSPSPPHHETSHPPLTSPYLTLFLTVGDEFSIAQGSVLRFFRPSLACGLARSSCPTSRDVACTMASRIPGQSGVFWRSAGQAGCARRRTPSLVFPRQRL